MCGLLAEVAIRGAVGEDRGMAHVVTVFRSRVRPEYEAEYHALAPRIEELARSMSGFVDVAFFTADDGERVTIVTFASRAEHNAWRDHPEHRDAQRLGRERFYASYSIQVAEVDYDQRYDA